MNETQMMEMKQIHDEMQKYKKYGQSGGPDSRGILTAVRVSELPAERPDEFSNAPFNFEDSASFLWEDTQISYYHACTANRFSEDYLKLCGRLEKNIRQLGSVCLTKAVMEQKGLAFPKLEKLSILELVKMVSYHMQKCHAAFRGIYFDNNFIGMSYLNWEFAWFNLGCRLKATEVKIDRVRDGSLNADKLLRETEKFTGEPQTNEGPDHGFPRSLQTNPSALPLDKSMARKMLQLEKEAEKARQLEERKRKEALRELKREERELDCWLSPVYKAKSGKRSGSRAPEVSEADLYDQIPDPTEPPDAQTAEVIPQRTITEEEARTILFEEAMARGDEESLMAIRQEDSETFHARWLRFLERNKNAPPPRGEISNETRKRLREKRKKRK